jgi:adenylate cyclase
MGRDEEGTVRDLEAHQAVILPLIAKHGGSVVNIAGDGIVAQFPSAVRAVECAVAIQKIMAERNFDVPADRRMLLRIGVNLGDIMHDGTHTYGDGINVAARLEPLAEPGGICISAPVREAIFGKLGLPLRDIGERSLKNIARPVHIYEIQPPGARPRRDWLGPGLRQYRRFAPALGLVLLLIAGGFGAWRLWPRETLTPDYTPVIAVLPFTSAGGDAALDRQGPSFAREVTSVLSTFPLIRVVSALDLSPQKVASSKQAAQALGANYALGGDLAKSGDKLRIRAQLTDATSGETVWSNSYEFSGEDPVASQEKTAERIYGEIAGISGKVRKAEEAAAWRKAESALTDYNYYLRSMTYYMRYTPDDNLRSRKIAEEGLARFPDSPLLKVRLAWTYVAENNIFGPLENCRAIADIAYKLGREAEEAKNKSRFLIYQNLKLMTHVYGWHGELDRSVQQAEAAVAMSPYDAELRSSLAGFIANAGKLDEAIEWASWVQAHDEQKNVDSKLNLAWANYLAGRAEEAVNFMKGVEKFAPDIAAAANAHAGRLDEARAIIADWRKTGPFSIATASCWQIKEPMKSVYLDDLRKAGLPER